MPTVNGLGLSFYATLILRNICVPRDFDAALPKHRKGLPVELQLTAGFHLRRTSWRADSAGFFLTLAGGGMEGY